MPQLAPHSGLIIMFFIVLMILVSIFSSATMKTPLALRPVNYLTPSPIKMPMYF